jgi:hypothetical protein
MRQSGLGKAVSWDNLGDILCRVVGTGIGGGGGGGGGIQGVIAI